MSQKIARTVDTSTTPPPEDGKSAHDVAREKLAEFRNSLPAAAASGGQAAPGNTAAPSNITAEVVDSVEFELLTGQKVVMAQPRSPAILTIARAFVNEQNNQILLSIAKVVCYIRSIDGEAVGPLANPVDFQAVVNRLGDDGIDMCVAVHSQCWPAVTKDALPALKKNLRRP